MANKTLILSITKAFGEGDRFDPKDNSIEKVGNQEIYRFNKELIFARDVIIQRGKNKTEAQIDAEICDFAKQVVTSCQLKDINKIIYFIHSEELGLAEISYRILTKPKDRIDPLKKRIKQKLERELGSFKTIIVAYKHGKPHFWSHFLYNRLKKKNDALPWVDNIELSFKARKALDNENKKIDDLTPEIKDYIKNTAKINATERYYYHSKVFVEDGVEDGALIDNRANFQVINTSNATFFNADYLKKLGLEIGLEESAFKPLPTIIIGEEDIMCNRAKIEDEAKKKKLESLELDKRYRFFDSSIWVRYVSKEKNQLGETLKQQLERVIGEFKENLKNKLYKTNVAKEYIEYHHRLFKNSYLKKIGGGHASDITPFMFHSETYMQEKANKLMEKFCKDGISWDLLLMDDFAKKELMIGNIPPPNSNSSTTYSKEKIINELLNQNTTSPIFKITSAATIDAGINQLKRDSLNPTNAQNYDAILLDYLFSGSNEKEAAKYGTELLVKINEDTGLKKAKAFNYKFWIYPVSVFSDALHSSLREQGVQYLEEDWVLGRGADPINTPQLFRYDFLDFIKVQYDGVLYKIQDIIDLLLSDEIEPDEEMPIDVRAWARRFYHSLWTKFGKAQSLIYKSRFTESVKGYKKEHGERKAFVIFENLETVLHNLAFASIFDFEGTEMTYLKLYEDLMEACDSEKKGDLKKQLKKLGEGIYGIHQ